MEYFSSTAWIRRFLTIGFALLVIIPLAACGGSATSTGSTTTTGPVKLSFWSWVPGIDKSVAAFNKSHPNIQVTLSNVGSGPTEYDKLFTAIKAKNEPDLAQVEFQLLPTFETTGSLVDMSKYGAGSVQSQFVPWTWSQVTLGSSIYAIPQDSGPMAMYYRTDIFKKYNLPVPTTWAQYASDAAKLHAANPNEYITDFPPKEAGWFAGLIWQAGGQLSSINGQSWHETINSPQALQVATYWQSMLSNKLVKTEPDFTNGWYNDLQTGAVATWVSAVWGASTISANAPKSSGDWAVAPIPQWQAGQTADGNWGGSTTVAFTDTKYPQQATEFATWLNTNLGSVNDMIQGASIYPASQVADSSSSLLTGTQAFYGNQAVFDVFKTASAQVNVNFQWGPTINQVYTDMGDNFANVVNGQGTLSSALDQTQQQTITFMKSQGFSVN